jgi:hypothetical protein
MWADLLTRWAAPVVRRVCRLVMAPVRVPDDFAWPSCSDIALAQAAAGPDSIPSRCVRSPATGLWYFPPSDVWIPAPEVHLQLRLLVVAHCGAAGHRTHTATRLALAEHFSWPTLEADVASFCQTCLHCVCTTGGKRVPRPLGTSLHSTKPNELLHFD